MLGKAPKPRANARPARRRMKHPTMDRSGKTDPVRAALYDLIGPGGHPCHMCGADVWWLIRIDNVPVPAELRVVRRDLDGPWSAENLAPSCEACAGKQAHE